MRLRARNSHAGVRTFDDAETFGDQAIRAALALERNEMSARVT
jgi:hypothetical protein